VKKLVIILSCIMLIIACDDGGDPTPENIFTGNEWEDVLIGANNIPFSGRTISFTENQFVFNDWSDNSYAGIYYNDTYTGTYKLLPIDNQQRNSIEIISDDPRIKGKIYYDYAENDRYTSDGQTQLRKAGSLFLYKLLDNGSWDNSYRMAGMFYKIN